MCRKLINWRGRPVIAGGWHRPEDVLSQIVNASAGHWPKQTQDRRERYPKQDTRAILNANGKEHLRLFIRTALAAVQLHVIRVLERG